MDGLRFLWNTLYNGIIMVDLQAIAWPWPLWALHMEKERPLRGRPFLVSWRCRGLEHGETLFFLFVVYRWNLGNAWIWGLFSMSKSDDPELKTIFLGYVSTLFGRGKQGLCPCSWKELKSTLKCCRWLLGPSNISFSECVGIQMYFR